jgi:hypothetical protein
MDKISLKLLTRNGLGLLILISGVLMLRNSDCVAHNSRQPIPISIDSKTPMTAIELRQRIDASIAWFKASQENNGHFKYQYNPIKDRYSKSDNIVRQMGAMYVLGETISKDKKNRLENQYGLKNMVEKALAYSRANTVSGEYTGKQFKCILKDSKKCSLGAVSLALIAVLDLVEKYPSLKPKYNDLIEGYMAYLLAMKKDNGGYRDSYFIKGEQKKKESDFSNGEAWFAMVRYYLYKPSVELKQKIDESGTYFVSRYSKKRDPNFYLWGVAALKDWYPIDQDKKYFEFVKGYTNWRIKHFASQKTSIRNKGAYIEALTLIYPILKGHIKTKEITFWLKKTAQFQLSETNIPFVSSYTSKKTNKIDIKNKPYAYGGFLTGFDAPFQRIDFTQHSMNSYLQWLTDVNGFDV